jgi:hypothetical protein
LYVQRVLEDKQNKVVITDRMWARLLSSTNQPSFLDHKHVIIEEDKEKERQTHSVNGKSHLGATTAKPRDTKNREEPPTPLANGTNRIEATIAMQRD